MPHSRKANPLGRRTQQTFTISPPLIARLRAHSDLSGLTMSRTVELALELSLPDLERAAALLRAPKTAATQATIPSEAPVSE
jgi:hypothetical protein